MGDTADGSWNSRELGGYIRREEGTMRAQTVGHTKGPWEVSKDGVPDWHVQNTVYSESGERVATVFQAEANARLIAAAPELLAEAKELLRKARYQDGQATVLTQDCEALEAVLARAEGR